MYKLQTIAIQRGENQRRLIILWSLTLFLMQIKVKLLSDKLNIIEIWSMN